jgi:hypothetical protein
MKTFHRQGREGREGKAKEQIKENESRAMKLWGMMGHAIDLVSFGVLRVLGDSRRLACHLFEMHS